MTRPQVLIVDDHAMFRTGLVLVLRAAMPEALIRDVGFLDQALALDTDTMDLVLLDMQLLGINGLAWIPPLQRRWPGVRILVVSSYTDAGSVREALSRGAFGFVAKTETATRIVEAVRHALSGTATVTAEVSDLAVAPPRHLTTRQSEVLGLMHQGLSNRLIARQLDLSENTVRRHVQDILAFFDVGNRAEAVFAARQRGLVY